MITRARFFWGVVSLLFTLKLSGCGGSDPYEAFLIEVVSVRREFNDILASVTDKASAEAAKAKITALGERMAEMMERMKKMDVPDQQHATAIQAQYAQRALTMQLEGQKHLQRIRQIPEARDIINDAAKEMILKANGVR